MTEDRTSNGICEKRAKESGVGGAAAMGGGVSEILKSSSRANDCIGFVSLYSFATDPPPR